MEICHWSKRLHLGTCIAALEFCPRERAFIASVDLRRLKVIRVVLTTSVEWGAVVTKLNVAADWKDLYAASGTFPGLSCCILHILRELRLILELPPWRNQPAKPFTKSILGDPQSSDDQNTWGAFGPLDL
ncbi:SEC12-like protein 1 [Vitis vinifera]|uniref:SEC12-like protein 1 n=1 Tax=Vitis vinifera TaxID=29760 RepID=A0A438GVH0_VITVI|nr:SEC12-like protein 1 [Vitis vinifera]